MGALEILFIIIIIRERTVQGQGHSKVKVGGGKMASWGWQYISHAGDQRQQRTERTVQGQGHSKVKVGGGKMVLEHDRKISHAGDQRL